MNQLIPQLQQLHHHPPAPATAPGATEETHGRPAQGHRRQGRTAAPRGGPEGCATAEQRQRCGDAWAVQGTPLVPRRFCGGFTMAELVGEVRFGRCILDVRNYGGFFALAVNGELNGWELMWKYMVF